MKINEQYYSKEQIKKKEHLKLLDTLMSECYGAKEGYNDIHIVPIDCGAFSIQWIQTNPEHSSARFAPVDDDETIMKEYSLPDNSYIYFQDEEEYKEYLKDWLKENPGWEKTQYGTWTNRIENEKFLADLNKTEETKDTGLSKEEIEDYQKCKLDEYMKGGY